MKGFHFIAIVTISSGLFMTHADTLTQSLRSKLGEMPEKLPDGWTCGFNEQCQSAQCTCELCGTKVPNGQRCVTDDNCLSGMCENGNPFGCTGKCIAKTKDGENCDPLDRDRRCESGQCTCGKCGKHLPSGSSCATNDNCISGNCKKNMWAVGCAGTCA